LKELRDTITGIIGDVLIEHLATLEDVITGNVTVTESALFELLRYGV